MRRDAIRRVTGLVLLVVSLVLLGWSLWPVPAQAQRVEMPGAQQLGLVWPGSVRLGDTAEVRLELDDNPGQPGNNASELLTARLDLPGLVYTPGGETSQVRPAGRPAVFRWTVRADQAGEYSGTVWLYASDPAAGASAAANRKVLNAQRFSLQTVSFFGLSARWAQALGLAGSAVGAVFGLDGVVFWFLRRFIIQ